MDTDSAPPSSGLSFDVYSSLAVFALTTTTALIPFRLQRRRQPASSSLLHDVPTDEGSSSVPVDDTADGLHHASALNRLEMGGTGCGDPESPNSSHSHSHGHSHGGPQRYARLISVLNAFAGGIFVNVALVHLLPEAAESLIYVNSSYRWVAAVALGLFGLFATRYMESSHSHGSHHHGAHASSTEDSGSHRGHGVPGKTITTRTSSERRKKQPSISSPLTGGGNSSGSPVHPSNTSAGPSSSAPSGPAPDDVTSPLSASALLPSSPLHPQIENSRFLKENYKPQQGSRAAMAASHFLFSVLAVHSFLAGTAVGIEDGEHERMMTMIAILAHKGSEAFAFGTQLFKSHGADHQRLAFALIVMFSLSTPLGIFSGLVAQSFLADENAQFTTGVIQAISSGTFIYIGFLHIFLEEYRNPATGKVRSVLALVAGFLFMMMFAEHHHEHGAHEGAVDPDLFDAASAPNPFT